MDLDLNLQWPNQYRVLKNRLQGLQRRHLTLNEWLQEQKLFQ